VAKDVPNDLRGHMIRFTAPNAFVPRPLYEVFDPKLWHANYADGGFFKDKVVIVGPSAQVFHDVVDTPMSPATWGPTLHFQAMAAALDHEFLRPTPRENWHGARLRRQVWRRGCSWRFVRKPLVCLGGLVAITAGYLLTARLPLRQYGIPSAHRPGGCPRWSSADRFPSGSNTSSSGWRNCATRRTLERLCRKSRRGNPGKPGQLLQLASWCARAGDDPVLGLDWVHHAGGESRPRSSGLLSSMSISHG